MNHTCHAHDCTMRVPPRLLFCRNHWFGLRVAVRNAVLREYRPGQEVDKKPSVRYLAVQRLAVAETAFKPNDEAAAGIAAGYVLEAEVFRAKAIEAGLGDPMEGL